MFDVATRRLREPREERSGWLVSTGGFWRPGPHLVLTQQRGYGDDGADLDQYVVVEPAGETSVCRIRERRYSPKTLEPVLQAHGFAVEAWRGDLTGAPYDDSEGRPLGVMARRLW